MRRTRDAVTMFRSASSSLFLAPASSFVASLGSRFF